VGSLPEPGPQLEVWGLQRHKNFLTDKKFHFFTPCTKAHKPVEAVIRHLPCNISAGDITVPLEDIEYVVINENRSLPNVPPQK
jgi:hypothetical protein